MKTFNLPPIYISIISLAWPLVLSNLSVPLLGLADSAMLGHLTEPVYLGAAAIGASIVSLILASFNFLRMSTTGLSAQAYGANSQADCGVCLQQGGRIAICLGLALMLISPFFIDFALSLMLGAEQQQLQQLAYEYAAIRFWAAPATLLNYVLIGWAIGQHNTRLAMLSLTSTTFINIALDYLLIVIFDFRSAGSAWATLTAEYCSCLICIVYIIRQYPWLLRMRYKSLRSKRQQSLQAYFSLNSDLFIRSACLLFVFAFFNSQSARLGEVVLAANAILVQLILFQSYALDGFAHATEALVGKLKGQTVSVQPRKNFRQVLQATALCSLLTAGLLVTLLLLLKPSLAQFFTQQTGLIDTVNEYLLWVIILPIISVWAYWLDGIAVGITASKAMRNSLLIACFLVFLPLWYLTQSMGNHGLWLSFFVFSGARGILLLPILKKLILHPATPSKF